MLSEKTDPGLRLHDDPAAQPRNHNSQAASLAGKSITQVANMAYGRGVATDGPSPLPHLDLHGRTRPPISIETRSFQALLWNSYTGRHVYHKRWLDCQPKACWYLIYKQACWETKSPTHVGIDKPQMIMWIPICSFLICKHHIKGK